MSDIIKISQLTEFDSTLNSINAQQVYIPIAYEKNTYKIKLDKIQSENEIKASLNDLQSKYEDIFENMSGEDNGDWEVIYKCTKGKYYDENTNTYEDEIYPETGTITPPIPTSNNQTKDYIPTEVDKFGYKWMDNADACGPNLPYVWVSMRFGGATDSEGITGKWGKWTKPRLWAHFGSDGRDGDGVEYVFCLKKQPIWTGKLYTDEQKLDFINNSSIEDVDFQQNGYLPIDKDGDRWTDDPSELTQEYPYQYVSIRKKQNGNWQQFSIPQQWNVKGKDGTPGASALLLDLSNDSDCVQFNSKHEPIKIKGEDYLSETEIYMVEASKIQPISYLFINAQEINCSLSVGNKQRYIDSNGQVFEVWKSSNDGIFKLGIVDIPNTNSRHLFQIEAGTGDGSSIQKASKDFTIAEVHPGEDGRSISYRLFLSSNTILADSDGNNSYPEELIIKAQKIEDGLLSNETLSNNLYINIYTDCPEYITENGNKSSERLYGTYKENKSIKLNNLNEVISYLRIELIEKKQLSQDQIDKIYSSILGYNNGIPFTPDSYLLYDNSLEGQQKKEEAEKALEEAQLMIWDNEQISKSRDGQDGKSQLLIKFDQNSFCIPVNNEGEYNGTDIVNDLNINVDFGIYEGYQLLDSAQFIDDLYNNEDLKGKDEYIHVKINGTYIGGDNYIRVDGNRVPDMSPGAGTNLIYVYSKEDWEQNPDKKNKFRLTIPESIIRKYCLSGSKGLINNTIRLTSAYANTASSFNYIDGELIINKAISGKDGNSGYTITGINDNILLDDDTISYEAIINISSGKIQVYNDKGEITEGITYQVNDSFNNLPEELELVIDKSGNFHLNSTKSSGNWVCGFYHGTIDVFYNGILIGRKTISVKISNFSAGETYNLVAYPNTINYDSSGIQIENNIQIYVQEISDTINNLSDIVLENIEYKEDGKFYLSVINSETKEFIQLIPNGDGTFGLSNLPYSKTGYDVIFTIGNNLANDIQHIECNIIDNSIKLTSDNDNVFIDDDCNNNDALKTLSETKLYLRDNGEIISENIQYSYNSSNSYLPSCLSVIIENNKSYLKISDFTGLIQKEEKGNSYYLPEGKYYIMYEALYNEKVYYLKQNIIIKELGDIYGYKIILNPGQITYDGETKQPIVDGSNEIRVSIKSINNKESKDIYKWKFFKEATPDDLNNKDLFIVKVYKSLDPSTLINSNDNSILLPYNKSGYTFELYKGPYNQNNLVDSGFVTCSLNGIKGDTVEYKTAYKISSIQPTILPSGSDLTTGNWSLTQSTAPVGQYLWMTTCIVTNGVYGQWTPAVRLSGVSIEALYSEQENPGNAPGSDWQTNFTSKVIWMSIKNIDGSYKEKVRLKGTDGTSIQIQGTYPTFKHLQLATNSSVEPDIIYDYKDCVYDNQDNPTKLVSHGRSYNLNNGDSYTAGGNLYVWNSEDWINAGNIKGQDGDSAYIHIKYSNNGETFTEDNGYGIGETPGKYIGILTNNIEEDSEVFADYTWKLFEGSPGEDAEDIEYIYTYGDGSKPNAPTASGSGNEHLITNDDWFGLDSNGVTWMDHPQGVSEVHPTEYMSYRTSNSTINPDNTKTKTWNAFQSPIIWSHWGDKGQDGDGVEYIYYRTTKLASELSDSEKIPTPGNNWIQDYVSGGWTDDPVGVDSIYKYEYVSSRKSVNGIFETGVANDGKDKDRGWSAPSLWSKWSEDGKSSYILQLDNDNVIIDDKTSNEDLQKLTECNLTLYLGTEPVSSNRYFTATCSNTEIFEVKNNNDKYYLTLKSGKTLTAGTFVTIKYEAFGDSQLKNLLSARVQTIKFVDINSSGAGYMLTVSPNSIECDRNSNNLPIIKKIKNQNPEITIDVIEVLNGEYKSIKDKIHLVPSNTNSATFTKGQFYVSFPINYCTIKNESSKLLNINNYVEGGINLELFLMTEQGPVKLDAETVDFSTVGKTGESGASGYSITTTNDNILLDDNTILNESISGDISLYKGDTLINEQLSYTVESPNLPTGMSVSISGNKFILEGNEKSWETGNFSFVISTTYDNKSIKKQINILIIDVSSNGETYSIISEPSTLVYKTNQGSPEVISGRNYKPTINVNSSLGNQINLQLLYNTHFKNNQFSKNEFNVEDNGNFYIGMFVSNNGLVDFTNQIPLEKISNTHYKPSSDLQCRPSGYDIVLYKGGINIPIDIEHVECLTNGQDGAGSYPNYFSGDNLRFDESSSNELLKRFTKMKLQVYNLQGTEDISNTCNYDYSNTIDFLGDNGESNCGLTIIQDKTNKNEFYLQRITNSTDPLPIGTGHFYIRATLGITTIQKEVNFTIQNITNIKNAYITFNVSESIYKSTTSKTPVTPSIATASIVTYTNDTFTTETITIGSNNYKLYYKEDSSEAGTELSGSTISLPYKKEGYIIELRGNDGVTIIQQAYLNCQIDPDAQFTGALTGEGSLIIELGNSDINCNINLSYDRIAEGYLRYTFKNLYYDRNSSQYKDFVVIDSENSGTSKIIGYLGKDYKIASDKEGLQDFSGSNINIYNNAKRFPNTIDTNYKINWNSLKNIVVERIDSESKTLACINIRRTFEDGYYFNASNSEFSSIQSLDGRVSSIEQTTNQISLEVSSTKSIANEAQTIAKSAKTTANEAKNTANGFENKINAIQNDVSAIREDVSNITVNPDEITASVTETIRGEIDGKIIGQFENNGIQIDSGTTYLSNKTAGFVANKSESEKAKNILGNDYDAGAGYLANGAIKWNKNGKLIIKGDFDLQTSSNIYGNNVIRSPFYINSADNIQNLIFSNGSVNEHTINLSSPENYYGKTLNIEIPVFNGDRSIGEDPFIISCIDNLINKTYTYDKNNLVYGILNYLPHIKVNSNIYPLVSLNVESENNFKYLKAYCKSYEVSYHLKPSDNIVFTNFNFLRMLENPLSNGQYYVDGMAPSDLFKSIKGSYYDCYITLSNIGLNKIKQNKTLRLSATSRIYSRDGLFIPGFGLNYLRGAYYYWDISSEDFKIIYVKKDDKCKYINFAEQNINYNLEFQDVITYYTIDDFDLYDESYIQQLHSLQSINQNNELFLNKDSVAQFYAILYDNNYTFEDKNLTTFAENIHNNLKTMQNPEKYKELYDWILN